MDNYELYRTRKLLENLMAQAFMRVGQGEGLTCSVPKCNNPASKIYDTDSKSLEPGLCYDCCIKELRTLAGTPLVLKLDESITNEAEAKSVTFSLMQKVIKESAKRNASNP